MSSLWRGFASDNAAGIHPAVLDSIAAANTGHAFGYGDDEWTRRVELRFREHFGAEARPYLVWGGTAATFSRCAQAAGRGKPPSAPTART